MALVQPLEAVSPVPGALRLAGERARPVVLARERMLPVLPAFRGLLAEDGLRRGTTVVVEGKGATSLALALAAAASQAGSWVAMVGLPSLGLLAATELGLTPRRLVVVKDPPRSSWAAAVAIFIDSVDLVCACPDRLGTDEARRLSARARERGAVLMAVGKGRWPQAPDVHLVITTTTWLGGTAEGAGRLRARLVQVVASGRGGAQRERRIGLWLPDADGRPRACPDERMAVMKADRGADMVDEVR